MTQDLLGILAEAQDGAFGVGKDQRIVFWNRSAERILGHSASEMLGAFCYEAFSNSSSEQQGVVCQPDCRTISLARTLKVDSTYSIRVATKQDGPKWLSVTHVLIPSDDEDLGVLAHIFHDVSEEMAAKTLVNQLRDWVPQQPATTVPAPSTTNNRPARLTPREEEVLRLLAAGMNTAQVANKLVITTTTARNHIQRLLSKLDVHSRLEAVVIASRGGFL